MPSDPVGLGCVDSLARPGGNITGLTWQTREVVPKRLQLLKSTVPSLTRVAVLWDPTEPARRLQVEEAERAATSVGVQVHAFEVRTAEELEGVFGAMAHARAGAVLVEASAMLAAQRTRIAELAVKSRLATIGWWRGLAEAGCLLSYSPSIMDQYRRAAYFVVKILEGAKPADLPVEQPTTFEFIINLKTASARSHDPGLTAGTRRPRHRVTCSHRGEASMCRSRPRTDRLQLDTQTRRPVSCTR